MARWTMVAAAAALAGFSVARAAGLFDAQPAAGRFVCPMHAEVVAEQPGVCPICDMRLMPRAAPAAAPAQDPSTAATVAVRRVRGQRAASAPATIVVPDGKLVSVSARASGWIDELPVAEVGRRVERGQVLATLDSPELFRAQQKFLNAVRWSSSGAPGIQQTHDGNSTGDLVGEARIQLRLAGLSDGDITALEARGQPRRAVAVRAPMAGVVLRKQVERGGFVAVGQELAAIADLATVWALADVPETDVGRMRVGDGARVESAGGATIDGRIAFIHATAEAGTRTVTVRVELPNPDGAIRPGTSAIVRFTAASADVLIVPAGSVVDSGPGPVVFVVRDGHHQPRSVVLGARAGDEVEIVAGLAEGEIVARAGAFLLEAESRLRAARAAPQAP